MYPAVQSFWTDGPRINASLLMFGGLHYLYIQTPTLHHPHLELLKYVNRNSLLHNVSVYCQLRYTATNRGEQIMLYRGLTELYKIGKTGVLQCMSFLIFTFHLSIKYTMISSPLPLATFDGATTSARQKVTYAVRWHVWNRETLHGFRQNLTSTVRGSRSSRSRTF